MALYIFRVPLFKSDLCTYLRIARSITILQGQSKSFIAVARG